MLFTVVLLLMCAACSMGLRFHCSIAAGRSITRRVRLFSNNMAGRYISSGSSPPAGKGKGIVWEIKKEPSDFVVIEDRYVDRGEHASNHLH